MLVCASDLIRVVFEQRGYQVKSRPQTSQISPRKPLGAGRSGKFHTCFMLEREQRQSTDEESNMKHEIYVVPYFYEAIGGHSSSKV